MERGASDCPLVNFESKSTIDERRAAIRQSRNIILEMAAERSERAVRCKQREDAWILPDLAAKLECLPSEGDSGKKRKKKKKKTRSANRSDDDEANDDGWEEVGCERTAIGGEKSTAQVIIRRDDWMELDSITNSKTDNTEKPSSDLMSDFLSGQSEDLSRRELRYHQKATRRREEEATRNKKWAARELNADVINSLRATSGAGPAPVDNSTAAVSSPSSSVASSLSGDGGMSWMMRALHRAEEQAATDPNVSVKSIITDRWGSYDEFMAKLDKLRRESQHLSPQHQQRDRPTNRVHDGTKRRRPHWRRSPDTSSSSTVNRDDNRPTEDADRRPAQIETTRERTLKEVAAAPTATVTTKQRTAPNEIIENESKPAFTDAQLNSLGAKLIKAEMLGNQALAAKLRAKMDKARRDRETVSTGRDASGIADSGQSSKGEVRDVLLMRTNARGQVQPVSGSVAANEATHRGRSGKRAKMIVTHDADGVRTRYFADDDMRDLKSMYESERRGSSDSQNALIASLSSRRSFGQINDDHDFSVDDAVVAESARSSAKVERRDAQRDIQSAMRQHKRQVRYLERCALCIGQPGHKRHLMIATGRTCYLALPEHAPLADGHCYIVPIDHMLSLALTRVDEDMWEEVKMFRRALVRMFASDGGRECIFFETCVHLNDGRRHLVYECVPVSADLAAEAPLYFQKAINECESDWADNAKLIDLGRKGMDVRRAVPRELPYFHVDFGLTDGFAHVIEDEAQFPLHFAHEIIGGMLECEPHVWRRSRPQPVEEQRRRVLQFGATWRQFDCTRDDNG